MKIGPTSASSNVAAAVPAGPAHGASHVRPLHLRGHEPLVARGGAHRLLHLGLVGQPRSHGVTHLAPSSLASKVAALDLTLDVPDQ